MSVLSNNLIARAIHLALKENISSSKILEFLVRKHLLTKTSGILSQLEKIINDENGTILAKVKSAKRLEIKDKKELEKFLIKRYSAKVAVLEEIIDQKLLGGFRVEINDEVIDLTLKNKILQLQTYLTRPA